MKWMPLVLALAIAATACAREPAQNESTPANTPAPTDTEQPLAPPEPGKPGGLPDDRTPVAEGPIDDTSAQGAAQLVQRYFALVEQRRFAQADALGEAGSADRFGGYREVHANIGAPGRLEGAAGSLYVDVLVQLYGRLANGDRFNRSGTVTVRRSNNVPGATPEQLRWRIYRIELKPPVQTASYRFVGRWATDVRSCPARAWRFTATSLTTPAGSACTFSKVSEVPGGYDIAARCTAEGPARNDRLELRFAESAKALLFESDVIADAGLVRCS